MIEIVGIGRFAAVLFDNDGVLVDSMGQVDDCWSRVCAAYGLDTARVFGVLHGRPAFETLSEFLAGDELQRAFDDLLALEIAAAVATQAMPGAPEIISALGIAGHPFTIATSATEDLARARLGAAGIAVPSTIVCADHVTTGKPAPEPYLLAAARLGVDPAACLVIEDAPSGIAAGRAAGCTVVALRTTHGDADLVRADHVVDDLIALAACIVS